MSSPVKNFCCALLLVLSGCGFQPMYGTQNQQELSAGVQIAASKDAMGQQFQQNLEDRLNPGGMQAKPSYRLSVTVASVTSGMGVARDGTVSRFNVTLSSTYVLLRLADNVEIQRGEIHHVSSFNNQANQYFSTYISEKDAIARGIVELSELYRQRIGALLLKGSAT